MRNVLAANLQFHPSAWYAPSDAQDLTQSFFAFFLRTKPMRARIAFMANSALFCSRL